MSSAGRNQRDPKGSAALSVEASGRHVARHTNAPSRTETFSRLVRADSVVQETADPIVEAYIMAKLALFNHACEAKQRASKG